MKLFLFLLIVWIRKTPVNYEIGFQISISDMSKEAKSSTCRKRLKSNERPLKDILLAINFNHPFYSVIPILEDYYKPIFTKYIFCGPQRDYSGKYNITIIRSHRTEYGFYGYQCLVEAILRNGGWQGYLLINDDMIINWWNFLDLDRDKIWYGEQFPDLAGGHKIFSDPNEWFERDKRGDKCSKFYLEMKTGRILNETGMFEMYEINTEKKRICIAQLSDLFYIPSRFASKFAKIAKQFYMRRIFLEVAVPMSIYSLDHKSNIIYLNGMYLQKKYGWAKQWKIRTRKAWREYHFGLHFLHPYKFHGANEQTNTQEFKDNIANVSRQIIKDRCLDAVMSKKNFTNSIKQNCSAYSEDDC